MRIVEFLIIYRCENAEALRNHLNSTCAMLPHPSPANQVPSPPSPIPPPPSSSSSTVKELEKEKKVKANTNTNNHIDLQPPPPQQQQQQQQFEKKKDKEMPSTPFKSPRQSHAAMIVDRPKKEEPTEQPPMRSGMSHYFQKPPPTPTPKTISAPSPIPSPSPQAHQLNNSAGQGREHDFEDSLGLSSTELDAILQMDFESSINMQVKAIPDTTITTTTTTDGGKVLYSSPNQTGNPNTATATANQYTIPIHSTMPPPPPPQQQQPINGICDICRETSVDADNPLLRCAQCGVVVHASCYGVISHSPHTRWQCDVCCYTFY